LTQGLPPRTAGPMLIRSSSFIMSDASRSGSTMTNAGSMHDIRQKPAAMVKRL